MNLKALGGWLARHQEAIGKALQLFLELRKAK